jgi:AcrR family transcriptional regulator
VSAPRRSIFHPDDPPAKAAGLAAALTLFVQDGIDATSVRDIARRSGFTNPAIFKHFDNKTGLALCLFERCHAWIAEAMIAAELAAPDTDPTARLLALASCALRLIDDDIEAVLLVQDNLRRFWRVAAPSVRRQSLLGRVRVLTAALADGAPGAVRPPPNLLATAIVGLLGQIAREAYFNEFPGGVAQHAAAVQHIILRLLRQPPHARGVPT